MPQIAGMGSKSDHGGVLITASAGFTTGGTIAGVDGDMHKCPKHGHGTTPVTSSSIVSSNGKKILRIGDIAGCGAALTTGAAFTNSD